MKGFRATAVLGLVVVAFGLYAYFVEYKGKLEEEKQQEEAARIFQWEREQVDKIELTRPDKKIVLKEMDGKWYLQEPVEDLTDDAEVSDLLEEILNEKSEEVVVQGDGIQWGVYGLEEPMGTVTVTDSQGESVKASVGSVEAYVGKHYLRIGEQDKILLVGAALKRALDKQAKALRDKRVLRKKESIASIAVKVKGVEKYHLVKKDGQWIWEENPERRLDGHEVDNFISSLNELEVKEFPTEKKSGQLAEYGLQRPAVKVELSFENLPSAVPWVLSVNQGEGDKVYAAVSERQPIYQLKSADSYKKLKKKPDDFFDRRYPFTFEKDKVGTIELTRGSTHFRLEKDDQWQLVPSQEGKEVDQSKVTELLDKLHSGKVLSFSAGPLNQVKGQALLKGDGGESIHEFKWGEVIEKTIDGKKLKVVAVTTSANPQPFFVEAKFASDMPINNLIKQIPDKPTSSSSEGDGASGEKSSPKDPGTTTNE